MTISDSPNIYLQDFGVAVVCGSASGLGILDMPDETLGGVAVSTEYQLTVQASVFSAAKRGDAISVGGVSYTVREYKKLSDGALAVIKLSKV